MTVLSIALLAIVAGVLTIWLHYRRNARLTGEMIALLGTHKTWLFSPADIAAGIKVSVKKAEKLIGALPADLSRYALVEGGIRFWGAYWSEQLDYALEQAVLGYAANNTGYVITAEALMPVLHNPLRVISNVLKNLANHHEDYDTVYNISSNCGSIFVPGVSVSR